MPSALKIPADPAKIMTVEPQPIAGIFQMAHTPKRAKPARKWTVRRAGKLYRRREPLRIECGAAGRPPAQMRLTPVVHAHPMSLIVDFPAGRPANARVQTAAAARRAPPMAVSAAAWPV